jgi:anti-sigma regulatory factor (Ser/Thr protein kinase)
LKWPVTASRTIRGRIEDLRPLARWAREAAARAGCAPGVCDDLDLCLHEAVGNIILHGYGREAPGEITVAIERSGATLRVIVEDHAPPFDPTRVPLPKSVPLEHAGPGGRGLVLIRGVAPVVRYERRGESNRLTLEFDSEPAS